MDPNSTFQGLGNHEHRLNRTNGWAAHTSRFEVFQKYVTFDSKFFYQSNEGKYVTCIFVIDWKTHCLPSFLRMSIAMDRLFLPILRNQGDVPSESSSRQTRSGSP